MNHFHIESTFLFFSFSIYYDIFLQFSPGNTLTNIVTFDLWLSFVSRRYFFSFFERRQSALSFEAVETDTINFYYIANFKHVHICKRIKRMNQFFINCDIFLSCFWFHNNALMSRSTERICTEPKSH